MAKEHSSPVDANSRLKARMRATVPPRETSLFKRSVDEELAVEQSEQKLDPVAKSEKQKRAVKSQDLRKSHDN